MKIKVLTALFICLFFVIFLSKFDIFCSKEDKNPVAKSAILEWLQKPAAVRFVGNHDRTYMSWIEHSGKVQIKFYDHRAKVFSRIYSVDDLYSEFGIESQDDHNAPNLLILPDGKLIIFYAVHDKPEVFLMRVSKNPEDIASWQERVKLNDKNSNSTYNYPQAKRLDNGNIILFYRKGIYDNSDEYFKISEDNGKTWGKSVKLIDFKNAGIYAFVYSKGNKIFVAWNKTDPAHPKKNIYYTHSPDGGKNWMKKDQTILNLPIREEEADLVFDSGDAPAYVWDIVADNNSEPFIVSAYKNDPDHQFIFSSWQNNGWQTTTVTDSSLHYDNGHFFSGGIIIDPNNVFTVYLSKKHTNLELEKWSSDNSGKTWKKIESITKDSLVDNFRPQLVQNYKEELRLIWSSGEYGGLIDSQWSGFRKVNIQSEVTKDSIPTRPCKI